VSDVAIDADVLGRQRTGDERYVANLLRELAAAPPGGLSYLAVTRHPKLVPTGVRAVPLPARSQELRVAWTLPRLLNRLRPALAHFQYVVPPLWRGPSVVTVHDLSFERQPQFMRPAERLNFRLMVPPSVRRAEVVLTVSQWSKDDIVERYGVPADRVVVTPNGVDPRFAATGPRVERDRPYLLLVGGVQPRKDPQVAVEALRDLPEFDLLLAGPLLHGVDRVRDLAVRLGVAPRVHLLGHVGDDDLPALYRGASCLLLPSRYEGFGLPVLEAMACGTPVVAARATSIPEVAGDAAVLVPPGDAGALADGVRAALSRRDVLVAAGLARVGAFSWAETARRTAAVYRSVVGR
jgi:glycosyltransferase involved in cell wall biosynthesis